ncbi:MAG TPA: GNAT family N-acetyltransferase [Coriobacteriia bacterium]
MRLATPSDANNLSALATQVFLHTYGTEGVTDDLSTFVLQAFAPDAFLRTLGDASSAIVVEEFDGGLIAFSELAFDVPCPDDPCVTTEITRFYVQEHFTRTGIGTRLLDASVRLARGRTGSAGLWLSVYAGNPAALAFYRSQGFEQVGTCWFELDSASHENYVLLLNETAGVRRGEHRTSASTRRAIGLG